MKAKLVNFLKVVSVLGAGIFVYSPALFGHWIWDDTAEILDNEEIKGPLSSIFSIWFHPSSSDYFPFKATVQWFEWHSWGPNPLGYHLVSVALHVLSAVLLWRCLTKLGCTFAWWGGLLFAVHPLAVESVAWISELKNTLSLPLLLFAWNTILDENLESGNNSWSSPSKLKALGWFSLAMLSKSSVVMFPVTYLLYIWWKTNRITWNDIKSSSPFFSVSAVLGAVTIWFQQNRVIVGSDLVNADAFTRIIASSLSILFYLKKALLPINLIPVYLRWSIIPVSLEMILIWFLIIGSILFLYLKRNTYGRNILFGLGFFGINLVPVLGVVPMYFMRFSWVSDHFTYISLIGIIALFVAGLGKLSDIYTSSSTVKLAITCGLFMLAGVLSYMSYDQAGLYSGGEAFWGRVCKNDPNSWAAHYNLAAALQFEPGKQGDAIKQYQLALNLTPDAGQGKPGSAWHANLYARVHTNLGGLLVHYPEYKDQALVHYQKAVQLDPLSSETHFNLGVVYQDDPLHKLDAITEYQETIRIEPKWVEAYYNLGNLLVELNGHESEAIDAYRKAIALRPNYVEAHYNLGSLLARTGIDLNEAGRQYEIVIKLNPKSADAYLRAGSVFQTLGKNEEAIRSYEGAIKLNYSSFIAHFNLGLLLSKDSARKLDAITHYQESLVINSQSADAHYNMANLLSDVVGREDEAIDHYESALLIKPNFVEAEYNLAILISRNERRRAEVLQRYQNALRLRPDLYFMHYHYALLLARDPDRKNEAILEFETTLKLNPEFTPARDALKQLR